MAELGAVASVLQVAQFGAQLSLTLYNVAQTVKSASQDVKRIAKEIALFAQVLKDLGSALERGQGSKIYRGDAYDTSRMIVEECEGVFKEIEEILFRRTTKESRAFDAALSIPKAERFLWVFRKGRVQLLRSNLESLKSTISLKLAVLAYADKHASSIKRSDDADDVLSLKSLVLANETATGELRELTTYTRQSPEDSGSEHIWSPGPIATHGIWNLSPTGKQMGSSFEGDALTPTTTPEPAASLVTPNLNMIPRLTHYNGDPKSPLLTYPKLRTTATDENAAGSQESPEHRRRFWGNQDKLELAVKKLDVAIWELGRIENNIKLGRPVEQQEQQSSLLIHLEHSLGLFGMSSEQVHWAMNRLANCNAFLGERTETIQEISKSDVDLRGLQNQGIPFLFDKDNCDRLIINRWLPDIFEDILWSHMKQRTSAGSVGPASPYSQTISYPRIAHSGTTSLSPPGFNTCKADHTATVSYNKLLPTLSHSPSQESFLGPIYHYKPAMHDTAFQIAAHIAKQQALMTQPSSAEEDTPAYSTTRRVSKAKKGKRVHACEFPGCDKVFTQAEHRRRHELNHSPEPYQCDVAGCQKSFHRPDLLARHMERQHNDPESRDYHHGRALSQVSMAESDAAHTMITTTLPSPLSPNTMLETATQPLSTMSIYSVVNHNTSPGSVTQQMGDEEAADDKDAPPGMSSIAEILQRPSNDLSQLPVPTGPHGFAPDLVYGPPTSHESNFYSSDSCYSPNPEYSHARIAGQSYLSRQDGQPPSSLPSFVEPSYHQSSCLQTTSTLPVWLEAGANPNDDLRTNPSSEFAKSVLSTASSTSATATSDRAMTSPFAERKRKNTQIGSNENAVLSYDLRSRQIFSSEISPPQKRRQTMKKRVVNDIVESNLNAEAKEATEEAPRVDPDQAVKNLLRKWTILLDMPLRPSY